MSELVQDDGFYKGLLDNLTDGIYFLDRERRITYWNRGAEHLTGYSSKEVLGRRCSDGPLQHMDPEGRLLCRDACPMEATMRDGAERAADVFLHHKMGHRVPIAVRAVPICRNRDEIVGAVEVFNDISGQVLAAQKIRELETLSLVDALTGAGNRRYAEIQLNSRLAEKNRYGLPVGLLFLDIDRFKTVNDRFGHVAGDDVLRVIGRTLASALRAGDFLGRWGGEEFVVLIEGLDAAHLREGADRLRLLVSGSSIPSIPGLEVTVSIGATEARRGDTVASLVARADARMYEAKRRGRNRVVDDGDAGDRGTAFAGHG